LCFVFIYLHPDWSLLAFGIAMISSSVVYAVLYYASFWFYLRPSSRYRKFLPFATIWDFLPNFRRRPMFDWNLIQLTKSFLSHSLIKQFLTEGERFIMTIFGVLNFGDQGIFDVISNLGSLVARLIFAPLEESAYTFFTLNIERNKTAPEQDQKKFRLATETLSALLKLVAIAGLVIWLFGMPYSYLALKIYGGDLLISGQGPSLLRWYCFYVLFLALNGITECFAMATMQQADVEKHQKRLVIFSCGYLIACFVLVRPFGSIGFVVANCLNMLLRIFYSCNLIENFFRGTKFKPLSSLVPNFYVIVGLVACSAAMGFSSLLFCCDGIINSAAHVAVGGVCVLFVGAQIWINERELIDFIWMNLIEPKLKKK